MKFSTGPDPRRNLAGRPVGRISKFRTELGELSRDGRTIIDALHNIVVDPTSTKKEVIEASSLLLGYLLGKPEASASLDVDVTARPGAALDMGAVLARLPTELVERVVAELDRDEPRQLEAASDDD